MKRILFLALICTISHSSTVKAQNTKTDSLTQLKIIAETKSQQSQAAYYSNQTDKSDFTFLIPSLGSIIVGFIAFGSAWFISSRNKQNENSKHRAELFGQTETATRNAAAALMKKTAEGFHSITWVTWLAQFTSHNFKDELIAEHDARMNLIYTEIAGAQVVLYSYNDTLYQALQPIFTELYEKDAELGKIAGDLADSSKRTDAIKKIGELWKGVYDYSFQVPKLVGTEMKNALAIERAKLK
jgi:uncharacterized protein YutD